MRQAFLIIVWVALGAVASGWSAWHLAYARGARSVKVAETQEYQDCIATIQRVGLRNTELRKQTEGKNK